MKFTLSWLKDHLATEATLDAIVETLTLTGLEVETVDDRAAFRPFVIAKVLSAEKHPQADRLRVLSVDAGPTINGGKPVQVVCGAPNARAGLLGAFAAPGAYIPGLDTTLAVGVIRGVESRGMMCSERELLMSDSHDGIIDLPDDAPVGASFADYAGLADPVIEINLTPNRPDAAGVRGIARDLAAAGLGTLKPLAIAAPRAEFDCPVNVTIEAADLCPAFGLALVRGVANGASPAWMQRRLKAIGLRPISALVDITNYVTHDLGRPLHVFDADKVRGNLVVRRARDGEKLAALDGRAYALKASMCVIADDNGPESLSGIMGGEASGCTADTRNVLVESALWSPLNIARTGRELGISTDARYRFERGVDPAFMAAGLDHAVSLVQQLCGGKASRPRIAGSPPAALRRIEFPFSETARLTGMDVPQAEAVAILGRLGFGVAATGGNATVTVPSWRPDIEGKADLVEEIMRIRGVGAIEPRPLPSDAQVKGRILTSGQLRSRNARRALAARGMLEAVTWSFIPAAHAQAFGGGAAALKLANPIAADMSDMRPSLLPGLIAAAQRNADRGTADVALFEVANIYLGDRPADQKRVAAGIRRATAAFDGGGRSWRGAARPVDAFDAKADALAALAACGIEADKAQIVRGAPAWYHPGRSGTIRLGPKSALAQFGELHPATLEALGAEGPLVGFEIFLDELPEARRKPTRTRPRLELPPLQAVRRDYAFVVDAAVEATAVIRAAQGADRKLIANVSVFDVFAGAALGEGRKSLAIEVTLQPADRTLTDEEIEAAGRKIVEAVGKATGGTLRT